MRILLGTKGDFELCFQIRSTPLASLWLERMALRHSWPLDHPDRFYGLNSYDQDKHKAKEYITECIDTINQHAPIIDRPFEFTQDCLNYLHHVFERYHGLLNQQNSKFWHAAPSKVRRALANLNLAVHRCETVMRANYPRMVCTWFGMPKIQRLGYDLQEQFGTSSIEFGTVYLNYCEIGKPVEDLELDNDQYIGKDAFIPFTHYSADFFVPFFDFDLQTKHQRIQHYIEEHQEFFVAHDIKTVYNIKAKPLRFPVADLEYTSRTSILDGVGSRQWVNQILLE